MAKVHDGALVVSRTLAIPLDELEWRFSGSGGPGGQHANTANTRVEVRFSIEDSASLGPRQREKLEAAFGKVVRVVVADERSQARNRELAIERLAVRVADALKVRPTRVATVPPRRAKEARLRAKHARAERKAERRGARDED